MMTPIVAIIVLLALLAAAGGAYYWFVMRGSEGAMENELEVAETPDPQTQALQQTSPSDDFSALEADLNSTEDASVEGEVDTLEQSL
jgi:flagellar basal body-associated protein FliL